MKVYSTKLLEWFLKVAISCYLEIYDWWFGKSKIFRVDQQAGDPGKNYRSSPKGVFWQNSFLLREDEALFYFNWLVETHPHYRE